MIGGWKKANSEFFFKEILGIDLSYSKNIEYTGNISELGKAIILSLINVGILGINMENN